MTLSRRLRHLVLQAFTGLVLLAGVMSAVQASTVNRAFTQRYTYTGRVDSILIGNQLMNCPSAASGCTAARTGSGNNNDYVMGHVDVDSVSTTFNSSSATLTLPAGSTVLAAYLYWGADTSAGSGGVAAPDAASRGNVYFAPAGALTGIYAADVVDNVGTRYSAVRDVTTLVQQGGSGTYTVGRVQAGTGQDRYAGWSLIVILRNDALPLRSVTLFDGSLTINNSAPTSINTSVSGFRTPAANAVGARIGLVAFEGDNALTGDQFLVNGTAISDGLNPATNVFNSTNSRLGVAQTARNPSQSNQFGFDVDFIAVPEGVIANNATSANLTFTTGGETYFPVALLFQTNVYEPEIVTNFTKAATDLNGGQFRPGDEVSYTINLSNTGDDSSDATVITDTLPVGITYVPGSLEIVSGPNAGPKTDVSGDDQADYNAATRTITYRVGTGATASAGGRITPVPQPNSSTVVRFRATIDANQSNGTNLSNVAGVTYVGATSGVPGSGTTLPAAFSVSRNADISITKTGPATVLAGGTITYTLTASSAGPDAADGATVTDNVPASLRDVSITCAASGGAVCPSVAGLATLSAVAIPTFPSGGQVVFTITARTQHSTAPVSNSASIAAPAGTVDPTPANNSAGPVTTTVQDAADLWIVKSLGTTGPYRVGDVVEYWFQVGNHGSQDATNVVVNDTPTNLTIIQISPIGFTCTAFPCTIPMLGEGSFMSFSVRARIDGPGAFDNSASVSSSLPDPNMADNVDDTGNGGVATALADLGVTKAVAGAGPYLPGQNVSYTITASNSGPSPATSVSLTDTLPAGTTFVSFTAPSGWSASTPAVGAGGTVTATTPSLASGANAVFTLTVAIAGNVPHGTTVANTASLGSAADDPANANNSATATFTVTDSADLSITKTAAAGPYYPGQNLSYTITASNAGPSAAQNASISDTLPAGTTFVSLTAPAGWSASTPAVGAGGTVTATTASFARGASATFTLTVAVPASTPGGTSIANTASVSSATDDPTGANDASTAVVTITPQADVSLSKTLLTPGPYIPGQVLTYSIVVANAGPSTATNVQVTDTPTNLTITGVTGGGCTGLPCTIPSIASGGSVTLTVAATIDAPGAFDNVAAANAAEDDPSPGNNGDSTGNGGVAAPVADLAVAKTRTSATPAPTGSTVTYEIVATNVDRQLGGNFRIGVGYNFTDFSDDLTDLEYDHRGFFLNLAGFY